MKKNITKLTELIGIVTKLFPPSSVLSTPAPAPFEPLAKYATSADGVPTPMINDSRYGRMYHCDPPGGVGGVGDGAGGVGPGGVGPGGVGPGGVGPGAASYVQMPVPWIALHEAPVGQPAAPAPAHTSEQYLPPCGELRSHVGLAVVPVGTSVGHAPAAEHAGEQNWWQV